MQRLFVATNPDTETLSRIESVQQNLQTQLSRQTSVRWTPPGQFHLTLKFIGETPQKKVDAVCDRLEPMATSVSDELKTEMQLETLAAFPNPAHPKVLWLGPNEEAVTILRRIHQNLEETLTDLDIDRSTRAFVPHLTIGRVQSNGTSTWPALLERCSPQSLNIGPIGPIVLYESKLSEHGATHRIIQRFGR